MNSLDEVQTERRPRQEIPFLVFEHAGCRWGVEVDQVETLISLPQTPVAGQQVTCEVGGQTEPAHSLSAWLGLDDTAWQPSRVLIARCGERVRAFLVEMPRGIVTLPLEAVYPMPVLVERTLGPSPFWGVGYDRQNDALLLLVDLGVERVSRVGTTPGVEVAAGQVGSRGGES